MEEGIVIGGGCTLLKLAQKVDAIKASLEIDEQRIGAEIVKRALGAPLKLIANNSGINGAVVMQKVSPSQTWKLVRNVGKRVHARLHTVQWSMSP